MCAGQDATASNSTSSPVSGRSPLSNDSALESALSANHSRPSGGVKRPLKPNSIPSTAARPKAADAPSQSSGWDVRCFFTAVWARCRNSAPPGTDRKSPGSKHKAVVTRLGWRSANCKATIAPALALENLFKWSKGNFDVSLLEKFIKCLGIYPIGTVVRLNTGEVGVVVATDGDHRIKPIVLLAMSAEGKSYLPRRLINLSSAVWEKTGKPMSVSEVLEPGSLGIELKEVLQEELNYSEDQISKLGQR